MSISFSIKILLILTIFQVSVTYPTCSGETMDYFNTTPESSIDTNYFYFRDGTKAGTKDSLIKECVKGVRKSPNGFLLNDHDACNCLITTITNNYTKNQFNDLIARYDDFLTIIYKYGKPEVKSELENCLFGNINKSVDLTKNNDSFLKVLFTYCLTAANNNSSIKKKGINPTSFCNCFEEKIKEKGVNYSELSTVMDSIYISGISSQCIKELSTDLILETNPPDVTGLLSKEYINILNTNKGYKVKLTIGRITKYFIIDSGASDIVISSSFENELIEERVIKKMNYLTDINLQLANGSIVKGRRTIVDNIKIGSYTASNVVIVILDSDCDYLLGKSFLEKFDHWSVENSEYLLLEKQ